MTNIRNCIIKLQENIKLFFHLRKYKMQSTVNQRIELLIKTLEKGKQSAFAKKIDVTPSVVNNIIGGRMNEPSFKVLQKITDAYANVNINWLISGEGEMLADGKEPGVNSNTAGRNLRIGNQAGRDVAIGGDCEQKLEAALVRIQDLEARLKDKDKYITLLERQQG
jgi:transcriptional regulator with XRE-family HTH domain